MTQQTLEQVAELLRDSALKRSAAQIARREGHDDHAYAELMKMSNVLRMEAEKLDPARESPCWKIE